VVSTEVIHEAQDREQDATGFAPSAGAEKRLAQLLERGLGLSPSQHMLESFVKQVKQRAQALGIDEGVYTRQLEIGGPAARTEWMAVAPALVVGETFLFRDAPLWNLIETTLLPSLAELTRPLWMWSAGCSTGEEAYTLAIVARRALGDGAARILGTDVNPKAIAAARVGVYGQWSLRGVEAKRRDSMTINGAQTVRMHDDVKSIVRFETHNLNDADAYPPVGMSSCELILCRNVLIYMSQAAREKVVRLLAATLTPGGLLILGHGEAAGIDLDDVLVVERHDAGVVFRRPLQPVVRAPRTSPPPRPARRTSTRPRGFERRIAPSSLQRKATRTDSPTPRRPAAPAVQPSPARTHLVAAMEELRTGDFARAERSIAAAIKDDSLDPEPYVLHAALLMARGALREAEKELRRALFLDPVFVPALWQAGNLYGITDRKKQAVFAFARALTQLDGLPSDQEALPFDNLTVGELTTLLRAELGEQVEA
jgi:chemotaxis protein methyltransferase CheR